MHCPEALQLAVEPVGPAGQGSQRSPQLFTSVSLTHSLPHKCEPAGQLGTHRPAVHDTLPPIGAGQGVQRSPHVATELFVTHWLLQSCVPVGQVEPHSVPSHVAEPPIGVGHGLLQRPPQLLRSVLLTH